MIGLIVDNFAGGGGASLGIEMALGRSPDIAVNHDAEALAMHIANHPKTKHYQEDVWKVNPLEATGGRPVDLAWFSPDCTHHSKAKGGKPLSRKRRCLAHVVIRWAREVRPAVMALENVSEWLDWGALHHASGPACTVCDGPADGRPCPARKGRSFRKWVSTLRNLGYVVEWRMLKACDYGAPTSRDRLFLVARCDGRPVVWPEPTHGERSKPWRTAAECIDWLTPCPSIFGRPRPLVDNTLRRIARGIRRYVLCPEPFIVGQSAPFVTGHLGRPANNDGRRVDLPYPTIMTRDGYKLVVPLIAGVGGRQGQSPERTVNRPYQTITTKADSVLVAAFLAKHFGGHETPGLSLRAPMATVTTQDHHALVTAHAEGTRAPQVRAFLTAYYGVDQDPRLGNPLPTVTTHDRFGVVLVGGVEYEIHDIGMRMLAPRELFRAQGFPDSYEIEIEFGGKVIPKSSQVRMVGNSVSPPVAAAIVRANLLGVGVAREDRQLELFGEDVA